jgi:hypothetical protein
MTVTGTLTNTVNSALIVKSGGSLIQNSGSVSATVERDIAAWNNPTINHGWHQLSSPVAAQAISPEFVASTSSTTEDFYAWYEPTNEWVNFKTQSGTTWATANMLGGNGGNGTFVPGKGYLVEYAATDTKQFSGTLNNGNITVTNLSLNSGSGSYYGSHLLGNPFTSALTWGGGSWALSGVNGTAKIWNEAGASYTDVAANGIIPALNGFMVVVSSGTNSLTIPTAARVHDAQSWYKETPLPFVTLVANDPAGQTAQESVIRFNNNATNGFDEAYDSPFFPGYAPKFYSMSGSDQLSTIALPETGGMVAIPFGFEKNDNTEFTIEARTISGVYGPVFLKDLQTNAEQDLTQNPVYSFTSGAGDIPGRFLVTFSHVGVGEKGNARPLAIYSSEGSICIGNLTGGPLSGKISVYNMVGQTVAGAELTSGNTTKISMNGQTGYYLVRVVVNGSVVTGKVFIGR